MFRSQTTRKESKSKRTVEGALRTEAGLVSGLLNPGELVSMGVRNTELVSRARRGRALVAGARGAAAGEFASAGFTGAGLGFAIARVGVVRSFGRAGRWGGR